MLYENMTFENIMDRCLSRVAASIDKREGSVVYDAIAPAAAELAIMYIEPVSYTHLDVYKRQALDGTYDGLKKKGFELSEAQQKIIETGTDMEKVARCV